MQTQKKKEKNHKREEEISAYTNNQLIKASFPEVARQ
jgi:hypothetical protein